MGKAIFDCRTLIEPVTDNKTSLCRSLLLGPDLPCVQGGIVAARETVPDGWSTSATTGAEWPVIRARICTVPMSHGRILSSPGLKCVIVRCRIWDAI